jgi:hypothetical protein
MNVKFAHNYSLLDDDTQIGDKSELCTEKINNQY